MLLWTRAGTSKKFVLARKQTAQRDIQNKETSSLHYWLSSLSLFFYSNIIHAMWLSIVSRLRPIYIICLTAVAEYLHISFYVGLQEPVLCLSITQWNKDRLKRKQQQQQQQQHLFKHDKKFSKSWCGRVNKGQLKANFGMCYLAGRKKKSSQDSRRHYLHSRVILRGWTPKGFTGIRFTQSYGKLI